VTWLVQARAVNDPFSDPGLIVDFRFGRRALLFDLGDLAPLAARELMRVSHVFVSHTHMDHFAGFDRLLRVCLHRTAPLRLVGPRGFCDRVEHRLKAYTWNLLDQDSFDFVIEALEFEGDALARGNAFRAREAFRRAELAPPALAGSLVLDEGEFRIECAVLDHGTPCLAFAFQETLRINVWREGLDRLGLPPGPWLNEAKRAIRAGAGDAQPIAVREGLAVPLGALKEQALRTAPGQRIAYVVDAAYHERNVETIVALARGADELFIEAAFLDEDAALAAEKRHLTAAQAGAIARQAGVARLVPLHFSGRYVEREDELRREVEAAFNGLAPDRERGANTSAP
jgi:ribonuclease Z